MTHKVHPRIFRIKKITDWDSRWVSKANLAKYLEEDFRIREFLEKTLKDAWIERIEIERFPNKLSVIINTARPGLIIGRGGKGIEQIKKRLEKEIKVGKRELKLDVREIKDFWTNAVLTSQWAAQQIEKRFAYRRVLKQALQKIMANKEAKGAKIELSGRLNGAEIARTEWLKEGRLPLQTIRARIDYGTANAHCTYGVIGVKVWIYKGEEFTK
ncbi:30S ribosomal protein S3 [Candidatus Parcubacteria bacterium]|nr:30S ribosomal protein S3 [Candidatus Parcubacteria bacterium]